MEIDWREDALCAKFDPEIWFDGNTVNDAKEVCLSCTVSTQCFRYAVASQQQHGVWGGVLFAQGSTRRSKLRELRRKPKG